MDEDENVAPSAGVEAVSADAPTEQAPGRIDVTVEVTGVEATMAEIMAAMSAARMGAATPRDDG